MSFGGARPGSRLPDWIRERRIGLGALHEVKSALRDDRLSTVCEEARCPNRNECFSRRTATFLINGRVCTRSCAYCSIAHGRPAPLDPDEPRRIAEAAERLGLRHAVVTAVDRDDLADGGAAAFAACVERLHALARPPVVEVLTPDFRGRLEAVDLVLASRPEVYNHNIETVPRLYPRVRRSGRYAWALEVLRRVAKGAPQTVRKSGLMVGLGEREDEVLAVLAELRDAGCQVVTIGQYLRPTAAEVEVTRYWRPDELEALAADGRRLGLEVVAGPFVRSSYHAEAVFGRLARGAQQ